MVGLSKSESPEAADPASGLSVGFGIMPLKTKLIDSGWISNLFRLFRHYTKPAAHFQ
jgi:hypothetical protein